MKPLPVPRGTCVTSSEKKLRADSSVVMFTVIGDAALNTAMLFCSSSASEPRAATARGSLMTTAGLAGTLSGSGPYSVFAPTNAAFAKVPAATLASLLKPANKEQLAAILTYHVAPGTVMAKDVTPGTVKTVNGANVTVAVDNGAVVLTDGQGNKAKVVTTDIVASNGVIHVIDAVLLPPTKS